MHKYDIWSMAGDDLVHPGENAREQVGKSLTGPHQIQVFVGDDPEEFQHLIKHLSMLGGDRDNHVHRSIVPERFNDWRHLDCFGSRTGDDGDFVPADGDIVK